jgi:hypothetical protein
MIPAWRDWQNLASHTKLVPLRLDVILPSAQAASGIFTDILPNCKALGYDIRWAKDGSVILDQPFITALYSECGSADPVEIRSRQNIDLQGTLPTGWTVEPRFPCPGHHSVPDGNGVMLNGAVPVDTLFGLNMPVAGTEMADILLCSGSNENMRAIPPSVFVNLAKHLDAALHGGAALPKQKRLSLFIANDRYREALNQMWPEWKDKVLRCYMDEGTAISLKRAAALIGLSRVTISPDTGTAHIALAAAMMAPDKHHLVFLPTREHQQSVFSAGQAPFYTFARKYDPHCDMACRGCATIPAPPVPKNYPWSLRCSRSSSVPCLMLSDAQCHGISAIAMAHLLALRGGMKCMTATVV